MYSREQVKASTDKVINMAGADAVEVTVSGGARSGTRWANSSITVNRVQYDRYVNVTVRLGQKTGAGWYRYEEDRKPVPDPAVEALIESTALAAGIRRRSIGKAEILERCLYSMINEGARILEEGYALRAGDIDTIYITGYGFPSYRGGPMWYAYTIGLNHILGRIREFEYEHGSAWTPAPLLAEIRNSAIGRPSMPAVLALTRSILLRTSQTGTVP